MEWLNSLWWNINYHAGTERSFKWTLYHNPRGTQHIKWCRWWGETVFTYIAIIISDHLIFESMRGQQEEKCVNLFHLLLFPITDPFEHCYLFKKKSFKNQSIFSFRTKGIFDNLQNKWSGTQFNSKICNRISETTIWKIVKKKGSWTKISKVCKKEIQDNNLKKCKKSDLERQFPKFATRKGPGRQFGKFA